MSDAMLPSARVCLISTFVLLTSALHAAQAETPTYDLVVSGGRVIDPESGLDGIRNVGVQAGKIAAISAETLRGTRKLDARGLVVAPGFIDLHAHGQQLPAARMQAFDGVTTGLELESGVLPVSRFYDAVAKEGRPINYGASVSWAAARYAVFNSLAPSQVPAHLNEMFKIDNWVHSLAEPEQSAKIVGMIGEGLREGGLGIGVLLAYAPGSGNKEYYAVNRLAAAQGVPTFTHVRYGSVMEPKSAFEAYQEVVATATSTGAQMHICHLNSTSGRDIELAAEVIGAAQRRGNAISIEAYPYPAASTMIGSAFFRGPDWQARLGGVRYEDFEVDGKPLDERSFNELQKSKPETVIVFRYLRPDVFPRDDAYLDASVLYPGGAIASDGVWWSVNGKPVEGDVWPLPEGAYAHPRSAGTFSRLLRLYVRESGKLTLMHAIEKASLVPARILEKSVPQMRSKGRIKEGADADLIVFDAATVADRATFEKPAQPSVGMRHVIVNGTPVIENGKLLRRALPGRPVRREIG
jgi:N-acyl-D-glutamate deacylase